MIFTSYLILLALTFLHPIEAFAPQLAEYRPVLVFSLIVLAFAIFDAVRTGVMAARARHLLLLGALMTAIVLSRVATGWAGGAVPALIEVARDIMQEAAMPAVHLDVPLIVDAGQGANWAEAH